VTWANAIKSALWLAFTGALLFVSAGTLDWPGAWTFLAELVIGGSVIMLWLKRHDPELFRERMAGLFQRDQAFSDKVFMATLVVIWHGWLVLMALDAKRWGISHVPEWLNMVGAVLIAVGLFVVWLTFRENSFAAPVVKIQNERGHRVISTGPYGIVRHPMYVGAVVYLLGMPLLLGSWLGLLVLPLIVGALVVRIFIEEATLREGLPGYGEYAARVRYRLIPGVW
jgi:protein-S-isoprenylcysteine O-methyltransferase Ste14